jgi:predicted Zn-dependent protease
MTEMSLTALAPPRSGRGGARALAALIVTVIVVTVVAFERMRRPMAEGMPRGGWDADVEVRMGQGAARLLAAEMGGAADPHDDPRALEVARVGRRIVQQSDARGSLYVGHFQFLLLNDPETINAFALPGGPIVITRGLFDRLRDEAELAGVLAHQLGHVVSRHASLRLAAGPAGRAAPSSAALAHQLPQLHFTPGEESAADRLGLRYMAQSGYDPSALLDALELLQKSAAGSDPAGFLATHAVSPRRVEELRVTLARDYPRNGRENLARGHPLIRPNASR